MEKKRQCLIGRTDLNEMQVTGLDGWLGKGATVTQKRTLNLQADISSLKRRKQTTLDCFVSKARCDTAPKETPIAAAKHDIEITKINSEFAKEIEPFDEEEEAPDIDKEESGIVPAAEADNRNSALPSFGMEFEFDSDIIVPRKRNWTKKNVIAQDSTNTIPDQISKEILSLDDL